MKLSTAAALIVLATATVARAEDPALTTAAPAPAPFHLDVEIDPTAYILNGYSLHVGLGWEHFRLDLGAFAMGIPEAYHGNRGFDASMNGYGAKLHYFLFSAREGGFIGVGAGVGKALVSLQECSLASNRSTYTVGVEAGWRFNLGSGFYATPWLGLNYDFNAKDVALGGETFQGSNWLVFSAVHLGRSFL